MSRKVSEIVSSRIGSTITNVNTWGGLAVNVKSYGALGDGVTDDTVAIQAAITYAISIGKKEVTFPAGSYVYTVLTNTSGMTFIGDGVTLSGTTQITLVSLASHVADYAKEVAQVFNAKGYGIVGDKTTDDTQAIINMFALMSSGDVAYFEKGMYRVTAQITIPKGVIVRGCGSKSAPQWVDITGWDETYYGTVFAIDWGSGGSSILNSAFLMSSYTQIIGCNFWYPNQSGDTTTPIQYPPTIAHINGDPDEASSSVLKTNIEHCVFVNSWIGMDFTRRHELLTIEDVFMSSWYKGIVVSESYDIDRINRLHMNPNVMYRGNWPTNSVLVYQRANVTVGFELGKADQIMLDQCFVYGYDKSLYIHTIAGSNPNGITIENSGFENGNYCIIIENIVRRIKLSNIMLGTYLGASGKRAIHINLDVSSTIDEIIMDNISIFQSANQAVYIRNASNVNIDKFHIYNACSVDPGFSISAIDIGACNGVFIYNSFISLSSANLTSTNALFGTINGFTIKDINLAGQKKTGSSELYISGSTKGRIVRTFITASLGLNSVTIATSTDVTSVDVLIY